MYVVVVVFGSLVVKEGFFVVGDRIVVINGIVLDNKFLNECEFLLCSC